MRAARRDRRRRPSHPAHGRRLQLNRLVAVVGAAALAVAAVATLAWSGSSLDLPDTVSIDAVDRWYRRVEPFDLVLAGTWATGTVIAVWLVIALVLQVLAGFAGLGALRGLADRISPRSLQRLGHALAGLSLTAGLAAAPSAGTLRAGALEAPPTTEVVSLPAPEPGTATMTRLPEPSEPAPTTVEPTTTSPRNDVATTPPDLDVTVLDPGGAVSTTSAPSVPGGVAPMGTKPPDIEPDGAAAADIPSEGALPEAAPAVPAAPTEPAPELDRHDQPRPGADTVVVEPGMSFWSIAEEVMAERGPFHARELHRYWLALIAANEDRLVVPGNADLLLPGQQLLLPPS